MTQTFKKYPRWLGTPAAGVEYRLYLSNHLMRDVIPIWNHYSTNTMVITSDLLRAELALQGHNLEQVLTWADRFRWVHSTLTPPDGVELRVIDVPGVLGWGFIEDSATR